MPQGALGEVVVSSIHIVCSIVVAGLVVALGGPLLKGVLTSTEKSQMCADLIEFSEQKECFEKHVAPQARANAEYAKAVGSALSDSGEVESHR